MNLRTKNLTISSMNNKISNNNEQISINNIPSALLGNIASYLHLSQQTSMIQCNRYICSSLLSSPARIISLKRNDCWGWFMKYKRNHGTQYHSYQIQKLNRFRMVKKIRVGIETQFSNDYPLHKSFPWSHVNLEVLELWHLKSLYYQNIDEITPLFDPLIQILERGCLKQLTIGCSNLEMNTRFAKLMEFNINIECLSLWCSSCDSPLIPEKLSKLVSKLKGLIIRHHDTNNFIPSILAMTSDQLMSLHLNISERIGWQTPHKTFTNLQELCINKNVANNVLLHFINSAIYLRRFNWEINDNVSYENAKYILQTIVCERGCIEYLCARSVTFELFRILCDVYMKNKFMIRNKMKIGLYFGGILNDEGLTYLKDNLFGFLKTLYDSVHDFLLILTINIVNDKYFDEIQTVLDGSNGCKTEYLIKIETKDNKVRNRDCVQKQIVICNKNCKMFGYRERWMYKCNQCSKQCCDNDLHC